MVIGKLIKNKAAKIETASKVEFTMTSNGIKIPDIIAFNFNVKSLIKSLEFDFK